MRSVVDASVAAKWLLLDERSNAADAVLTMVVEEGASVPAIFPFEVENILIVAERRGRIDPSAREAALDLLRALDVRVEPFSMLAVGKHVALAQKYALSAYDAAYVVLAKTARAALYTADARLAKAARAENVMAVVSVA